METKTNALRILDKHKILYKTHCYPVNPQMCGAEIAALLGEPLEYVFKTLVTIAKTGQHYVFMIPVAQELDLKKAAVAVGEKRLEMIPQKELLVRTGYVHGGCSPIGMKKLFPVTIDISAQNLEMIFFSAGRIGMQIEANPRDLKKLINLKYADVIKA